MRAEGCMVAALTVERVIAFGSYIPSSTASPNHLLNRAIGSSPAVSSSNTPVAYSIRMSCMAGASEAEAEPGAEAEAGEDESEAFAEAGPAAGCSIVVVLTTAVTLNATLAVVGTPHMAVVRIGSSAPRSAKNWRYPSLQACVTPECVHVICWPPGVG